MKKQLLLVVMAVLCLLPKITHAQINPATLAENHKKYWEQRDRLRKFFVKIGGAQGESLPAAKRNRFENANTIRWGDVTTELGWYISVLATEYKLLSDDGQPTQGTLNELYYAIKAFNRLDLTGEVHYADRLKGEIANESLNGWFIRDDVDKDFYRNWDLRAMSKSYSDFYDPEKPVGERFLTNDDPSQDQIITLFQGFALVKKYVDDVYVDPEGNNQGFNIVTECQEITRRIMGRLQEFKPFKNSDYIDYCEWCICEDGVCKRWVTKKNYTFTNPIYDWEASGGNDKNIFYLLNQ